jgi:hypothetical protein
MSPLNRALFLCVAIGVIIDPTAHAATCDFFAGFWKFNPPDPAFSQGMQIIQNFGQCNLTASFTSADGMTKYETSSSFTAGSPVLAILVDVVRTDPSGCKAKLQGRIDERVSTTFCNTCGNLALEFFPSSAAGCGYTTDHKTWVLSGGPPLIKQVQVQETTGDCTLDHGQLSIYQGGFVVWGAHVSTKKTSYADRWHITFNIYDSSNITLASHEFISPPLLQGDKPKSWGGSFQLPTNASFVFITRVDWHSSC